MRARQLVAVIAPLLVATAPLVAQKPTTTPPPKPATAQPKPATPPTPAAAPAPAPVAAPVVAPVAERLRFEITGGVGATVVDMSKWAAETVNNSSALNYWGAGRVLFPLGKGAKLGVEAGYHYHFWWNVYVGPPSYTYQHDVTAKHVAAMVRLPIAVRTTLDLGGGLHFFNNAGTHLGALAAVTYHIPLTQSLDLPVGVRADAIFTNPTIIPVVLNVGLGFRL